MNKKGLFTLLISLMITLLSAQEFPPGPPFGGRNFSKIDALEKTKIIEVLNLDEETSIKLFARRNELMNKIRELSDKRESILESIELKLTNSENVEWEEINKVFDLEKKVADKRLEFFRSLEDIISREQIAKLMVFERKFRRELRDIMMRREVVPGGRRGFKP